MSPFYGAELSLIHHCDFGDVAESAAGLLVEALARAGHRSGTMVDLGCGSGILAGRLANAGYDVVGVDISEDMVALARRTAPTSTFHHASVLDFKLPECVAVTAVGEVLNYATAERTGPAELEALVRRVHGSLVAGGLFVLDLAGPGRSAARPDRFRDRGSWLLGAQSIESDDRTTLERSITIFTEVDDRGRWRRIDERHVLRLYEPPWVEALLRRAGFAAVEVESSYGGESINTPPSGWAVFVAKAGVGAEQAI